VQFAPRWGRFFWPGRSVWINVPLADAPANDCLLRRGPGFFENGKTKLVMPALAQGSGGLVGEPTRDSGGSANGDGKATSGTGASGGGGNGGQNDPLIRALIQKLPRRGRLAR